MEGNCIDILLLACLNKVYIWHRGVGGGGVGVGDQTQALKPGKTLQTKLHPRPACRHLTIIQDLQGEGLHSPPPQKKTPAWKQLAQPAGAASHCSRLSSILGGFDHFSLRAPTLSVLGGGGRHPPPERLHEPSRLVSGGFGWRTDGKTHLGPTMMCVCSAARLASMDNANR